MNSDESFDLRLASLLADPAHADNPLRAVLGEVSERYARQRRLVTRMMRISDRAQAQLREVNITLSAASQTDLLTGLANRRHMMEQMRREARRAQRTGQPMVVMLGDIDRFKSINDRWGHEMGDTVLASVADVVQAQLRDQDLCSRWGGEEFLFLLPETPIGKGMVVAERLREAVAACRPAGADYPELAVSLSIGVAGWDPGMPIESSIQRADRALYEAKAAGRNRCMFRAAA